MQRRTKVVSKLVSVAKRARTTGIAPYDEELAQHAREVLQRFVALPEVGTQKKAGAILGVDQSTIQRCLTGPQQPQLALLIELRKYMAVSIDHMLALPPVGPLDAAHRGQLRESLLAVVRMLDMKEPAEEVRHRRKR